MKAAISQSFDHPPRYGDLPDATATEGQVLVNVKAAALTQLTKAQAAGKHYSSKASFPAVPGADGVGRLPDGQRVYFVSPAPPHGAMAEYVAVEPAVCVPIPAGVGDVLAAAIANPGMSSWGALVERAKLIKGESVLINGATGVSGQLAIQIARFLGARRIIATGRNPASLAALTALGADEVISLLQPPEALTHAFKTALHTHEVSVILDYLWGPTAEQLLATFAGHGAADGARRVRFVQIGATAGATITLPGAILRSSGLELLGSGFGSLSRAQVVASVAGVLNAIEPGNLVLPTEAVPLSEVESNWDRDTGNTRLVFTL